MNTTLVFNLFLFSCLLLVTPSKSDNISDVCDKAQDPNFCTSTLGSAPGAKTATTAGLEEITLSLTEASATATNNKIQELLSGTKDPNLQALFTQCGIDYKDASIKLQQAKNYLANKQFVELAFTANGISNDGITCESSFQKGGVTSPITQQNNELSSFSDIIRVIAHILAGGSL
ncbi:hypothetical protein RND71_038824 [Anisodus tanguticus]|uniref:Pectinesterase inhibitor domain-containing protein n=1 Tax=Anisodus tanguticus TaxID=243964 RepID=A0AAE1R187_9SOLA|nr:hypothetical protein RND71_038824 [Anisodus tanguticus]